MAINLVHAFVTAKAQSPDSSLVSANQWNAQHVLQGQPLAVVCTPAGSPNPQALVDLPATADGQVLQRVAGALAWTAGGGVIGSPTAHGVLIGEGAGAVVSLVGPTGTVLQGQGAAADPIFTATPTVTSITLGTSPITSPAGAAIQLGAADAAAPVAQMFQVQSVLAGTSNTAGVNFTIKGSAGTGTGVGGSIIFQTANAGGSGTTQNAFVTALTIDQSGGATVAGSIGAFSGRFTSSVQIGPTNITLTAPTSNTLQLGAADAAVPVAQTLQVQSVVAGTSNTAGADWTFVGSKSTGNAAGGRFVWQTSFPGSSGTSQNAAALAMRLTADSSGNTTLILQDGITGVLNLGTFGGNGLIAENTAALSLAGNSATVGVYMSSGAAFGFGAAASGLQTTGDTVLTRKAAANWQLGFADAAAPVAQTLSVQSVVAGTSNTAGVDWTFKASAGTGTGAGGRFVWQVATAGGTGTSQNSFANAMVLGADSTLTVTGTIIAGTNNTIGFNSRTVFASAADGQLLIANNAGTHQFLLCVPVTATLQLGAFDAAAPVAQTLQVQSVVAGTSNTAGVNWTFKASAGTGTGAGGSYNFQVAAAGSTGTAQNAFTTVLVLDSNAAMTLGASGYNAVFQLKNTSGTTILTLAPTTAYIQPAAGTASVAPLQYTSGTNLTSAAAGACEFDGVQYYATIDTTGGRAALTAEQYFHLTADGSAISTIANFFGTTSNISLVANAHYIIEAEMWMSVQTGTQTATWTFTNSAAPSSQNIDFIMSPVTGIVAPPGTATMLEGQFQNDTTAARTVVTGALTAAAVIYTRVKIWLINGTGTSLKIQLTSSANTLTPLKGSWWRCRRVSPNNIGTFAA